MYIHFGWFGQLNVVHELSERFAHHIVGILQAILIVYLHYKLSEPLIESTSYPRYRILGRSQRSLPQFILHDRRNALVLCPHALLHLAGMQMVERTLAVLEAISEHAFVSVAVH